MCDPAGCNSSVYNIVIDQMSESGQSATPSFVAATAELASIADAGNA
jgi:hypothetical protein